MKKNREQGRMGKINDAPQKSKKEKARKERKKGEKKQGGKEKGKKRGKKKGKKKGPILRRYDRRGGGRIGPPGGYSLNL
ncbi:MAG: hypothetical protein ACLUV4_11375 [Prevotella sp.]